MTLSPSQRLHLRYLRAWQTAYSGDYASASPLLKAISSQSTDTTLQFRAVATLVNMLAISAQYEEAFLRLNELIKLLPQVSDGGAREQGLVVAAMLYNQVSQYELAIGYADKLIEANWAGRGTCNGGMLRLEALHKSGRLRADDAALESAIDACSALGEKIHSNFIRTYLAKLNVRLGLFQEVIALLEANYEEVLRTNYPPLISEFDALLAQSYRQIGKPAMARRFAMRAIEGSVKNEFTVPIVAAYRELYLLDKSQGDFATALIHYEKFAAADKGHLNDVSARQLAYQRVKHEAAANRLQIDALGKRNQVLQLQQKVSKSAAQTRGLYILLLLSVLAFIAMWLYKTKRSQLHFMKLARRDGLTGIFNRAHFGDAAESILAYCRKGEREACVVLIDLDNFKRVNDSHGHAAGDTVLRRTVQACQAHLRSIDIIGRLGGEEFGIVLPDCDPTTGLELAERFRLAIADLSNNETGVGFPVSASFGLTSSRWSGYNLKQLLIHADKALYVAKNNGRNQVAVFDDAGAETPDNAATQSTSFDRRRA